MKKLKKYFPFVFCFIVMLLIHSSIEFSGDDLFFQVQLDKYNLIDYLILRYNTWSSRLFVETLFVIFNKYNIVIWKIIDSLFFSLIAFYISKIFNKNGKKEFDWIIVLLVLLYPFNDISSAGYVTTSIAYAWPTLGLLYLLYNVELITNNNKLKWYHYLLSILAILVTTSMEQSCLLLIGFCVLYILKILLKKEFDLKKHWYIVLLLLLSLFYIIFILSCPGNAIRTDSNIAYWYPNYANYGIKGKLYLGIVPTMALFLRNKIVLTILSIFLCILTFVQKKERIYKLLSIIVLSFVLAFGLFRMITLNIFPSLELLTNVFDAQDIIKLEYINIANILPLIFSIFIAIIIGLLLFVNFGKRNTAPLFIYIASLCSRLVMGFSPTIFASADRTAFFTYIGFLVIIYLMYLKIINNSKSKEKSNNNYLYMLLLILAIFNVTNVICTLIIVFK